MSENPLVSISVLTYNSSKFIFETLESIKNQTYKNIELIISDDCSKDNSVQICKEWLAANSKRFVRSVLLESPVNTGVTENCNRAKDAAQGVYIKGCAGDDRLKSNCIAEFVKFAVANHADCVLCKVEHFSHDPNVNLDFSRQFYEEVFQRTYLSREEKIKRLAMGQIFYGPGLLFSHKLWSIIGGG